MKRQVIKMTNIPIYRAKHFYYDRYVTSDSVKWFGNMLYLMENAKWVECVSKTMAISFPNIIDKNGKKIFASLSEDGVGGDDIKSTALGNDHNQRGATHECVVKFFNGNVYYEGVTLYPFNVTHELEVIGIHK